jgi:membrane-associated protease RseP (regulator of RpoE activity)
MHTTLPRMAALAWLAVTVTVSDLPAQDGPLLVQRDGFVIPPPPDEPAPDVALQDVEAAPRAQPGSSEVPSPPLPADPQRELPPPVPSADGGAPPLDDSHENYLGVFTDPLPPALADQFRETLPSGQALLVTNLVNGAAADQAGLRVNDILVSYDGEPLASPDDLKRLVIADEPGATVEFSVIRSAEMQTVRVTLGRRPIPRRQPPAVAAGAPLRDEPFPIGVHLPDRRSIIVDRYGLRSPWISVDWGSPLAGRRFQALTPDGRQFDVEVRIHSDRRGPYWRD